MKEYCGEVFSKLELAGEELSGLLLEDCLFQSCRFTELSLVNCRFSGCRFVDFSIPGLDAANGGMDWCSLRLVFEPGDTQWLLVGIIHGQWTI